MGDILTAEDRALIDQALSEGKIKRLDRRRPAQQPPKVNIPSAERHERSGKLPQARRALPAEMSVRAALEWAFGTECATMDADELEASAGGQRPGVSMEYILQQRFMLGGVSIDTSPGVSRPADDADIIASVVRATLRWPDACWVADLARAGRTPDPMIGVVPTIRPEEWHGNRHGWHGKARDSKELGEDGWPNVVRRNRKGAIVREPVRYTPCVWHPEGRQIATARRAYLDWWGHLLDLQAAFSAADLKTFTINGSMPPLTPWRDCR